MENEQKSFDDLATQAIRKHNQHQAKVFYEQAVGRLLDVYPLEEAKEIIDHYTEELEDNS